MKSSCTPWNGAEDEEPDRLPGLALLYTWGGESWPVNGELPHELASELRTEPRGL